MLGRNPILSEHPDPGVFLEPAIETILRFALVHQIETARPSSIDAHLERQNGTVARLEFVDVKELDSRNSEMAFDSPLEKIHRELEGQRPGENAILEVVDTIRQPTSLFVGEDLFGSHWTNSLPCRFASGPKDRGHERAYLGGVLRAFPTIQHGLNLVKKTAGHFTWNRRDRRRQNAFP